MDNRFRIVNRFRIEDRFRIELLTSESESNRIVRCQEIPTPIGHSPSAFSIGVALSLGVSGEKLNLVKTLCIYTHAHTHAHTHARTHALTHTLARATLLTSALTTGHVPSHCSHCTIPPILSQFNTLLSACDTSTV